MENMRRLGKPEKQLLPGLAKILAGCPDEDDDILYMDSDMLADNDIAIQFEKVKKSRGLAKAQAESKLDQMLRDQERREFPA